MSRSRSERRSSPGTVTAHLPGSKRQPKNNTILCANELSKTIHSLLLLCLQSFSVVSSPFSSSTCEDSKLGKGDAEATGTFQGVTHSQQVRGLCLQCWYLGVGGKGSGIFAHSSLSALLFLGRLLPPGPCMLSAQGQPLFLARHQG